MLAELFTFREGLYSVAPMTEVAKGWSGAVLQQAADLIAALPPPKPPKAPEDPTRMVRACPLAEQ